MKSKLNTINRIIIFSKKQPIAVGLILMTVSAFFIFISIKSIIPPPEIVTRHKFQVLQTDIIELLKKKPNAVIDLKDLCSKQISSSKLLDGWGNSIHYKKTSNGTHTLISYGKDGVEGFEPDLFYEFKFP
jgi:hypothetical protein